MVKGTSFFKVAACAAALLFVPATAQTLDSACGQELDIGIALDQSSSVFLSEFDSARTAVAEFIDDSAAASPGNRYAVVYFDSDTSPVISLVDGPTAAAEVRGTPRLDRGGTNFAAPLGALESLLAGAARLRVAILVTDGATGNIVASTAAADSIKAAGVTLVTAGVGPGTDVAYLESIASKAPDGTPYYFASLDFDDTELMSTLEDGLIAVCEDLPEVPGAYGG